MKLEVELKIVQDKVKSMTVKPNRSTLNVEEEKARIRALKQDKD